MKLAIIITLILSILSAITAINLKAIAGGKHWTGCRNTGVSIPSEMKQRWVKTL